MSIPRLIIIPAVALAAAAALTLAGCSSAKPSAAPTATRTATAAAAPSTPAPSMPAVPATPPTNPAQPDSALCTAGDLSLRLGSASGSAPIDQPIVVTNTSASTCVLDGYPSVQFVRDAVQNRLGPEAVRDRSVPVVRYPLAAGESAGFQVYVSDAAQACSSPVSAAGFRVVLPATSFGIFVPAAGYSGCADVELLSVTPVIGQ
jgi:hypothetical protein